MTVKKAQSLQRVLESSAAVFVQRGFGAVSLTEISGLAHCSTTTIYEVFGSKENLFLAAMAHTLKGYAPPGIEPGQYPNELEKLVHYAEARIRWLATPQQRRICTSLISPFAEIRHLVKEDFDAKYVVISGFIVSMASKCIDQRLLRPLDLDVIVHGILSGTIYQPFVFPLLYGEEVQTNFRDILHKVFAPLVTPAGKAVLDKYLREMEIRSDTDMVETAHLASA
jgi:AcrR family transcriptional regulator